MKRRVQRGFVLLLGLLLIIGLLPAGVMADSVPTLSYRTHVQNDGWQNFVSGGTMSGTSGRGLRLEGIEVKIDAQGYDLGVAYQTHIQNIGWEANTDRGWKSNGVMSGTSGLSYRLEGIQIKLTGIDADKFDIYYQVHAQNFGWLDWAKNGASAGTEGLGIRLEGIFIVIVPIGSDAPGVTNAPFISSEALLSNVKGEWYDETMKVTGPHLKISEPNEENGLLWLGSKWYENRYRVVSISRDGESGIIEAYKWNYYKPTPQGFVKTELDINPPDQYVYDYNNNTLTEYRQLVNNVRVTTFSR